MALSAVLSLLSGCGNSTNNGTTSEDAPTAHETATIPSVSNTNNNILSNGQAASIIPVQATGDGEYYLAPSVQFAKIGTGNKVTELTYIDENGDNHFGLENIFETELKVMPLDIHYSSANARDNYADMGHWRTSFTSRMDFPIDEDDIKDKSNFYDTPRDACESGFGDMKESVYRGILKDADAVYDENHNLCVLKQDGKDIGKFVIWNRSQNRDDIHYVETATQEFLVFQKNDEGKFVSEQKGIVLELAQDENGTYSYKDASDVLRSYNKDGKLISVVEEGQEARISYDSDGRITKIVGALDNTIDFKYNDNNLTSEIIGNNGTIKLTFKYNDKQFLTAYSMNLSEGDDVRTLIEANYAYDANNLLSTISSASSVIHYTYDLQNRVSTIESDGLLESIQYEATKVTKLLPNNTTAIANISFTDGKQTITDVTDSLISSEFSYNKKGLLSDVGLSETVVSEENASSSIQSNAANTKVITLKLQMDYTKKGLISSQYLETSDGKKGFTNFEYKTRYNKPTKILTEEDVTFFDFNNKGQLIKKAYLKYDKEIKIKPHTLEEAKNEVGYEEKSFTYDENGFLRTSKDEITGEQNKFFTDKNGILHKGNIQANALWYQRYWWQAPPAQTQNRGEIPGVGTFNMQDATRTQTVFVGGASDETFHGAVKRYWDSTNSSFPINAAYYTWDEVDTYYDGLSAQSDRFKKQNGKLLMVIGHSYGGDSIVEASKESAADKQVDLLITVDPVGTGDTYDGAKHWIELYADPGRWYGYLRVKWKKGCCGIRYPAFYWEPIQWDPSDWIAFAGGKGWYSSYDPGGDAHPDKFWKTPAHHKQFAYLLQEFQESEVRYDFNIRGITDVLAREYR